MRRDTDLLAASIRQSQSGNLQENTTCVTALHRVRREHRSRWEEEERTAAAV